MEQRLWRETQEKLNTATIITADASVNSGTITNNSHPLSLQTLSTLHSLITNPSTSSFTISSIFETLTHFLSLSRHRNHHFFHHIFSLLSSLAHYHPSSFSPPLSLSSSLLSDTSISTSPPLVAAFLSLLLSVSAVDSLDGTLLVSLCYRNCVSFRVWFLNNAARFSIRPNLLLTFMLGFTNDPFPCVRNAALEGLFRVCDSGFVVEDSKIIQGCFFRAVELLSDQDYCVRLSAIRSVSQWGCILAASNQDEEDKRDCYDGVFLQICSMVRDMNMGVRVEAFTALGRIAFASHDILLQTLSKRILGTVKGKLSLALCSKKERKMHDAFVAGAFIHGLEDEYNEVRCAACISLRMLPVVSGQFADEAIKTLSYALNDDSVVVRLESLKTIHHMAMSGCLKMQEAHIDMLLGTLVESSACIRSRTISILGSVTCPDIKVSKSTVESLLGSLEMYPKSEAEIFCTLFKLGQNHVKHAASIIQDFYHEIERGSEGKSGCNSTRTAGLLVLAISASLKDGKHYRQMPPRIFSYAAAYFGRISFSLSNILDVDSLLQYLLYHCDWLSEVKSKTRTQPDVLPVAKIQQEACVHLLNELKLILATVKRSWQLIQCGCTDEALKTLRCCKESLVTKRTDSSSSAGAVAFALQYVCTVKLLTKVWENFVVCRHSKLHQIGKLDLLLEKLNKAILALKYRFTGLTRDVELFIMELLLLSSMLQLSSSHTHCRKSQKLSIMVMYMGQLTVESIAHSDFVNQVADLYSNGSISSDTTCDPIQLKKLCNLFMLKDLVLTQGVKHINTEIFVHGFDFGSPLRFMSGFPLSIPLKITLYNVTNEHRLWLKVTLGEVTEFVFLDLEVYGGLEEGRQFRFNLPFYKTPKAADFTLRVSMGIECMSEDLYLAKGHGGPKHVLTYITPEIEVYFVNLNSGHLL